MLGPVEEIRRKLLLKGEEGQGSQSGLFSSLRNSKIMSADDNGERRRGCRCFFIFLFSLLFSPILLFYFSPFFLLFSFFLHFPPFFLPFYFYFSPDLLSMNSSTGKGTGSLSLNTSTHSISSTKSGASISTLEIPQNGLHNLPQNGSLGSQGPVFMSGNVRYGGISSDRVGVSMSYHNSMESFHSNSGNNGKDGKDDNNTNNSNYENNNNNSSYNHNNEKHNSSNSNSMSNINRNLSAEISHPGKTDARGKIFKPGEFEFYDSFSIFSLSRDFLDLQTSFSLFLFLFFLSF